MKPARSPSAVLWGLLAALLLWRLATLGLYPLRDTTEARYGEMARKMLETGNWITPLFDYDVPFWGKPPLSFWTSAASMAVFGVNEFGARLGPWVCTVAVVAAMLRWRPADGDLSRSVGLLGSIVFVSSLMGFLAAGAVMTDMAMTVGTTLSMVAFWRSVREGSAQSGPRSAWPWLFFVGQAIGLLAKGPVAPVITALPIAAWLTYRRAWRLAWKALPWVPGSLLMLAIAVPWYALAEQRTPGFLRYFLIGEHFERFTQSGWRGDLYGAGHAKPRGTIWLYGLASALPWPIVLAWLLWRRRGTRPRASDATRSERSYLLLWALSPLIFFTLARNILPAYVLPGLPAFALLTAGWIGRRADGSPGRPVAHGPLWTAALVAPALLSGVLLVGLETHEAHSQRRLIRALPAGELPLVYLYHRPYSAQFYSAGKALEVRDPDAARARIEAREPTHLIVPHQRARELQDTLASACWRPVVSHGGYMAFGPSAPERCTPHADGRTGDPARPLQ